MPKIACRAFDENFITAYKYQKGRHFIINVKRPSKTDSDLD